jgi:16S rRNA (cytosine1402-N4)-methyltransferase
MKMVMANIHESVLVSEVIEALHIKRALRERRQKFIDATVGTGGHALEIVKAGGCVLGIDLDPGMLEITGERLEKGCLLSEVLAKDDPVPFKLVCGNFKDIDKIAREAGFSGCNGIIFDLGVSNIHLMDSGRGFSFRNEDAILDMRLDKNSQAVTASDLLNGLRRDQLVFLFGKVLRHFEAKKLADRVVAARSVKRIRTVGDFLSICEDISAKPALNSATLPFLAVRMAVNSELENLGESLPKAWSILKKGGRLLVITFHSGEEAVVKDFERKIAGKSDVSGPIVPGQNEISANPRSRSARLRVFLKN